MQDIFVLVPTLIQNEKQNYFNFKIESSNRSLNEIEIASGGLASRKLILAQNNNSFEGS